MNHASTTSHHIADAVFVCVFRAVFERVFRDAEISGSDFKISGLLFFLLLCVHNALKISFHFLTTEKSVFKPSFYTVFTGFLYLK